MRKSTRRRAMVLLASVLATALSAGFPRALEARENQVILASSSSIKNSGLFAAILPIFTARTGIVVRVVARGTGHALQMGRQGTADALLVHDRPAEERFVTEGHGLYRKDVMQNDLVQVGPRDDPAGVSGMTNAAAAFARIAQARAPFASRGDDSGIHRRESALWQASNLPAAGFLGTWYRTTRAGMAATLNQAIGMGAYTLVDRATWTAFPDKAGHRILVADDPRLLNAYGIIVVNPARHPNVNAGDAEVFATWLTGPEGQAAVAGHKIGGRQLYFPPSSSGAEPDTNGRRRKMAHPGERPLPPFKALSSVVYNAS